MPALPDWLSEESIESGEPLEWAPPTPEQPLRRYDLNQATLGELERLPGVGFILAQSIVRYREINGPFEKVEDLLLVPGLNPTTLEFIQDQTYVSPPAEMEPVHPAPVSTTPALDQAEAPEEIHPARQAFDSGNIDTAASLYSEMIRGKQHLAIIIKDLQQAVQNYPQEALLWQALGDALIRTDRAIEAVEAYTRAEELLF
jgi:competence ComEA-like helix-hairpin-helix protein